MEPGVSRAAAAFAAWAGASAVFGEVLLRRASGGHSLRHAADDGVPDDALAPLGVDALRGLARATASGAFRPLKGAPSLRRGWRCDVPSPRLEEALGHLYPGGLADWFAVASGTARPAAFADVASRQGGIYRGVKALDDGWVADVASACCGPARCLKRRLWTAPGAPADDAAAKSAVPCLEPCAVLLDLARLASRWASGEALPAPAGGGGPEPREGELSDPRNPRHLDLLRARDRRQVAA